MALPKAECMFTLVCKVVYSSHEFSVARYTWQERYTNVVPLVDTMQHRVKEFGKRIA
jgi:hypothetical protein